MPFNPNNMTNPPQPSGGSSGAPARPASNSGGYSGQRYTFDGKTYDSYEQATAAQDEWFKRAAARRAANEADLASVGYNFEAYTWLRNNKAGLADMSDSERDFIIKRYQASNPYDRKAYTKSAVDQYLSSVGLPAAKELDKYRKAFYDYASGGGIEQNYPGLDRESYEFISKHWQDGMQTGIDGKLYTAKGKAVEYKDTLLDQELQANGLPPSALLNDYFLDYQQDKKIDSDISDFYAAVYKRMKTGTSSEEAYRVTLADPQYRHLSEYVSEAITYPKQEDYADNDPTSATYGQTDKTKYDTAWNKALAADAKRDTLEHRVSYADYERYAAQEMQRQKAEQFEKDMRTAAENAGKWVSTPATTDEEKAQRRAALQKYYSMRGEKDKLSDPGVTMYFDLLDAGVPAEVINGGYAAIAEWNETKNKKTAGSFNEPSSYAVVKLRSQGYTPDDGDWGQMLKWTTKTQLAVIKPTYEKNSQYAEDLYAAQTYAVGHHVSRVTPQGALYAAVNGRSHADVEFDESSASYSLYTYVTAKDSNGKCLLDYMTDDEKGTFNVMCRMFMDDGARYIDGISGMLEDRKFADEKGSFDKRCAMDGVDVPREDVVSYYYDCFAYQQSQNLRDLPESDPEKWKQDAWQQYSTYSDKQLQEIVASVNEEPSPESSPEEQQENESRRYAAAHAAQYVLDTRAELRKAANVQASLYGYTDEAGKAATASHDYAGEIGHSADGLDPANNYDLISSSDGPRTAAADEFAYYMNGGWSDVHEQPLVEQMTQQERDRYNWLYANEGPEAAQAYYRTLRPYLDDVASKKKTGEYKAEAKEKPFLYSLASVGATMVSGPVGISGSIMNWITGTDLTKTQTATWDRATGWRQGVSEDWSPGWQFVYQGGMSLLDSGVVAGMAAIGVPPAAATSILATSAYTSTLHSAMDRGLSGGAAYTTAAVAGFAEWITEEIGLENLLEGVGKLGKEAGQSLTRQAFTNIGKQMLCEGSEEVNSDIINFVYDNLFNGNKSEFRQHVNTLVDAGYTQEEATRIAWGDQIKETALSFVGGAASGGIMAGFGNAGKIIFGGLYNYAYGNEGAQAGTSAPAPAQTGASVRVHADAYANGRGVVDRLFGENVGNNVLYALDNNETKDTATRIDAISEGIAKLDNTSYLYGYTHDAEGNLTLTDDERTALASVLAMAYSDANGDNIDAAFVHAMSQLQSEQQRASNTNYDWIKNPQDVRNVTEQMTKTQESINTIETQQATKLADAQSAYNAAVNEVKAITKKLAATSDAKEKMALQASLKTAQDKRDNIKARLNTVKTTDAATTKERIKAAKEEVARQQTLLDRHYASASAFLNEFAPASFSGATASRASLNTRMSDIGAKIDAIMASDMEDSERQEALASLHDELADAGGSLRAIDARLSNADPAALTNALNAMKTGQVSDFVRSQKETSQKAAESAQTSNAGESSSNTENAEGTPSDTVKQDNTEQRGGNGKKEHVIGARVQKTFDRIAKKFGCEIVWGDDGTSIGETGLTLQGRNGAYNPAEPNRIYLNTTMVADGKLTSTQAVAREFFTHEIVHYVANTKTYTQLLLRATEYYDTTLADRGGSVALVNAIVADEQQRGRKSFTAQQAQEEMTAHFAQEVLFAGTDGNRRALVWLARSDRGIVGNFLTTVEFLIKRGNVRRAGDNSTVKTMLLDAELELVNALKERQYLDRQGKTSAFQRSGNAQTEAKAQTDEKPGTDVANSRQGMNAEDYVTIGDKQVNADPEKRGIEQQIAASMDKLAGMSPVFSVENRGRDGRSNAEIAQDLIREFGGEQVTIKRNDYGEILLDYKRIMNALNKYLHSDTEIAAFSAVPSVLENGIEIAHHSNHKGRGYSTTTFGAPITLNGTPLYLGVTVKETDMNRYSVHRVLMMDGKKAVLADIKENTARNGGSVLQEAGTDTPDSGISMDNMPQDGDSVNIQNSGTPTETLSDVKAIFNGKGDVMNSRGTTVEDYLPIDFSKNKLLQKNGQPYKELYSGTNAAGFPIFDPTYADDGLSNFATSSKRIAQSYTGIGEYSSEYVPSREDGSGQQVGNKGRYLHINTTGQYGYADDNRLFTMLLEQSDYAFDAGELTYARSALQSMKNGKVKTVLEGAMDNASVIVNAASHLARRHSQSNFRMFQTEYEALKQANERLAPVAKKALENARHRYADSDYRFDSENEIRDTEILAVTSYLRTLQTGVEDAMLNSGIYDVLQRTDAGMIDQDDAYIGFDSRYKGKARLYSDQSRSENMPTYGGEEGYYKLKIYAENPLDVDVQDQNWDTMDVNAFPSDVREKLAGLYGYKLSYRTREVSRAAYETGYDAVVFRGLHDTNDMDLDEASDVIITYKPYQSKSVYNMSPTTDPRIMFSTGMNADDYIRRYGQKQQNVFGQANNIRTPNNVDNDAGRVFRVSDTAQTLKEVAHIRQVARDVIDEGILQQADGLVERHGLVYEPVTTDRMNELGDQFIADHGGLTQAMRDLTRDMPRARQNELVQYMAAANKVFTEIGAEGTFDPQEYYEFVASYVEMRSNWGRVGRAMQLVNDSPLGRVAYWQRVVQRINEKNGETVQHGLNPLFYRNGAATIDVPQTFFDALAQARNQEEIDAAEYAITQYIGQHSPLTVSDALRNWRYFAMLANPVTHMRNMLGNTTMLGGRVVKDTIAAGMENVAVRMGLMDADERTHAVVLRQDADTREYVRQLWEDNADAVQSGGRDGFQQTLSEAVRKSPFRAIDRAMRFNGNALESEDRLFLHATFTAAAAQYIQAQGLDVNNITREQRGAIVNYATQQAQEATYRDASRLADALNQFAKSGWGQQLLVDAIIPFKKTPINIFKRGIEYSPAGLARGLVDIGRNAVARNRGGQPVVRASVVVDELAKGLTGSALALLGFFLSRAGILKVTAGEGDKDSAFERDIGRQDYSLEIGDVSIKIESLAPLTFPLFMGAQLQRLTSSEHDGLSVSDLAESVSTLADPLMDMSFMSSLNDVLSTYNENKLGGVVTNAAQAYLGQYLPTIGSKLNQTINTTRRTSKASQASPVGTGMDYWLRSMASKIPGVNQAVLEPYVKTTGEYDEKTGFGDYVLSAINNFVSPVNVQIVDTSPVNKELSRLVTVTGATDFVPQNPKKYLTIKSERYNMTAKEYTLYSKEHNETVYAVLTQVIQSPAYARATDEQRADMLKKAYDSAHKTVMNKYKAVFAQK